MNIFLLENNVVKPTPESLMLDPIKKIWDRDKSPKKEKALKEISYIEFMKSFKKTNPFIGYDDFTRHRKICEFVFQDSKYIPDAVVKQAMTMYDELQNEGSLSLRYYKSLVKGVEKIIKFVEDVNLNERDVKNAAIWNPSVITNVTKTAGDTLRQLNTMREQVEQELYESSKTRGNREINPFEIRPDEID